MSGELQVNTETGRTLYFVVWNASGQAWNGSAFATYTTTRATWDVAMSESPSGTGHYIANFPAVGTGRFNWEVFMQAGASPSHTDDISLAIGEGYWNGTAMFADAAVTNTENTISAAFADSDHTWRFDSPLQLTAPNDITELIGFAGLLAMDFTEPMPADASISSITSVTVADVSGATEPTITSSAISPDKRKVHVLINAALATAATYAFTVTILTTDSQTFTRKGRLVLQ